MMNNLNKILFCLLFYVNSLVFAQENKMIDGNLVIFHAGSLSVPFKEIIKEFNIEYPNIKIQTEIAGSVECARKITELDKYCDIIATSDYKVIDNMLVPKYADWNIKFASNELSIVYNAKSRYANEITNKNWLDILMKKDVIFGRADQNSDPCGYRTVMTIKLAEKYYNKINISDKILNKDINFIRPKEVDLLALLETQTIDYIFLYRSVAIQHNLKYISLPDEINLKSIKFADNYAKVNVEIKGKNPYEKQVVVGEPMVYGISVLKKSTNKQIADLFLYFLLNKSKGLNIMEKNGQKSFSETDSKYYDKIPIKIKKLVNKN